MAFAIAAASACSRKDSPVEHMAMGEFVEGQDSFPRIRYFDTGRISLNDRCAVRKVDDRGECGNV